MSLPPLEFTDEPPPSINDLRRQLREQLVQGLSAHPEQWALLDIATFTRLGGLSFSMNASDYGIEIHCTFEGERYVRLKPTRPPKPRWWRRMTDDMGPL